MPLIFFNLISLRSLKYSSLIEELLYIMRLIDVGVKEENCKHIINELFDENIGLA